MALLRSDVLSVETVTVQAKSAELDRQRLARLFDDHAASIRGLVGARCGDWALADDITARTFLDAAEQLAKGRAGDVTRRWLHVVALRRSSITGVVMDERVDSSSGYRTTADRPILIRPWTIPS